MAPETADVGICSKQQNGRRTGSVKAKEWLVTVLVQDNVSRQGVKREDSQYKEVNGRSKAGAGRWEGNLSEAESRPQMLTISLPPEVLLKLLSSSNTLFIALSMDLSLANFGVEQF